MAGAMSELGPAAGGGRRWESRDIKWKSMDKTRFFGAGVGAFLGVRAIAFPASLVKTRLQVGSMTGTTRHVFKTVWRNEGVRGFYKGFGTASLGMVPAQCVYLMFYESLRDKDLPFVVPSEYQRPLQTFWAGAASSMVSQLILTPSDVISQRLMVQQREGAAVGGARAAFTSLYAAEGLRGLYRGYFATIAVSAPSSALWWTVYMSLKPVLLNAFCPLPAEGEVTHSRGLEKLLQASAGLCAGMVAATLTNPLDVLKVRLQVDLNKKQKGLYTTLRVLLLEDGVRGLGRGLSARVAHSAPASVLSILTYEALKEFSHIEEAVE